MILQWFSLNLFSLLLCTDFMIISINLFDDPALFSLINKEINCSRFNGSLTLIFERSRKDLSLITHFKSLTSMSMIQSLRMLALFSRIQRELSLPFLYNDEIFSALFRSKSSLTSFSDE